MLIYIQTSTVQNNLSRVLCSLPVSIYLCTNCTLYRTYSCYSCLAKPLISIMQNACIFRKCNEFGIAIQWFCMNKYPSFVCTKTQPYASLVLTLFKGQTIKVFLIISEVSNTTIKRNASFSLNKSKYTNSPLYKVKMGNQGLRNY